MIICPSCSSADGLPAAGRCNACGWQRLERNGVRDYLTEADRKSGLAVDYASNYEGLAQKNLGQSNIDRRFLHNQAKNMIRYLGPVAGKAACEVGIGQGFLCRELLAAGVASVAAVDLAVSYLRALDGMDRVEAFLANAEALPFRDEFDLLVSTDVMEHVLNLGSYLYCLNRALKAGGTLAVRVPYREGLLPYSPYRGYGHAFGHMRSFNKDLLRIHFAEAGFRLRAFHVDGYSLGSPQPHLYDADWKKGLYQRFCDFAAKRMEHPADATLWNSRFARLFMRPVEIVAVGVKTRDIA
jgi:SAM-dependent methyltransferase